MGDIDGLCLLFLETFGSAGLQLSIVYGAYA